MRFKYKKLDRIKAKIRRFWTEDNWKYLRIAYIMSLVLTIVIPYYTYQVSAERARQLVPGYYTVEYGTGELVPMSPWSRTRIVIILCLIIVIAIRTIASNLTRTWITDRFDDILYLENGNLCYLCRHAFASGINTWTPGRELYERIIPLSGIKMVYIDKKSKRVEIQGKMYFTKYVNENRSQILEQETLDECKWIFYDFYRPSLIKELKKQGIPCQEGKIKFGYRDAHGGKKKC